MLAISQIGTVGNLLMLASAPRLHSVFLARIPYGMTAGNMSIAITMTGDSSTLATRKRATCANSAKMVLSLMIRLTLSAFVAGTALSAPFWVAGVPWAASVATTTLLLKRKDAASPAIANATSLVIALSD
ncbi:MAG: hypothetical protein ABW128_23270 [Rhizorhabdus sp.]